MSAQTIYTLTVPSTPESLPVLEGLCETFITENESLSREIALILRLSVTEACENALKLTPRKGRLGVATLTFQRLGEHEPNNLALEIQDSGEGLPVEGHAPPYPEALIGKQLVLNSLLDQEVIGEVLSPWEVALTSRELSGLADRRARRALTGDKRPRGFGLLALCRCWQKVRFSYDPESGTTLHLERPMRSF